MLSFGFLYAQEIESKPIEELSLEQEETQIAENYFVDYLNAINALF